MRFDARVLFEVMTKAGVTPPNAFDRWEGYLVHAAEQLNELIAAAGMPTLADDADDNAIVEWANVTPELAKLRVYKYLNTLGYRMAGIDQRIGTEERRQKKAEGKP